MRRTGVVTATCVLQPFGGEETGDLAGGPSVNPRSGRSSRLQGWQMRHEIDRAFRRDGRRRSQSEVRASETARRGCSPSANAPSEDPSLR